MFKLVHLPLICILCLREIFHFKELKVCYMSIYNISYNVLNFIKTYPVVSELYAYKETDNQIIKMKYFLSLHR